MINVIVVYLIVFVFIIVGQSGANSDHSDMAASVVGTSLTDGALDLSAKSSDHATVKRARLSPVPSVTSEPDSHTQDRSSSVSSDGHETDGSTSTAVKAIAGPLPSGHVPGSAQPPDSPPGGGIGVFPSTPEGHPGGAGVSPSVRPFKMYPFESMQNTMYSQIAAAASSASAGLYSPFGAGSPTGVPMGLLDGSLSLTSPIGQFLQSRKRRLDSKCSPTSSSTSLEDKKMTPVPEDKKDETYWERRRKNNDAAKRSRDARRAKEEEIALRAAFLEQENLKLRAQVAILKNETAKLHYMLYNRM